MGLHNTAYESLNSHSKCNYGAYRCWVVSLDVV